ncbi:MAG: aminoacetone oxidase family FAD-binding enzyme [Clostridiales bacterium]|nr:aminoacetone oxidase family FAD-binding enzyme [Clostridiales bacterium]
MNKTIARRKILQKLYNTIIVGGGAAGLLSATELVSGDNAFKGEDILILERNDRVGKKLVATGNGQGNLTNDNFGEKYYYGDSAFIKQFVSNANKLDIKKYFANLGIYISSGKDGKAYPLSKQASAVLDCIRSYLSHKNCKEMTGKKVTKIEKKKGVFEVYVSSEKFLAKSVIVCTGGSAGKQFGTDGSAYALVEKFGHKKTELYPSLVQLKTPTDKIKGLKGIKENARVTAFVGAKPLMSVEGDLLFTDFGVSGSTIFSLSASVADKKDAYLIIEFLPSLTFSETENIIKQRQNLDYVNKEDLLVGVINKKVGQVIIKNAKSLNPTDIAYTLKNFKLDITGTLGFNYAQVTKGGIKTSQITPAFESKLAQNLYIAGEILNVDGDCGGYNLTFAFVSGVLSARDIKEKLQVGD